MATKKILKVNQEALLLQIEKHRESAFSFQERRHSAWKEIYQLYRDKVIINRITQRQSVNIPLIKETIKTILSDIDDPPDIFFASKDNNKEIEIEVNEYWRDYFRRDKIELKDIADKKQELLYGRTTKVLNLVKGFPTCEIYDVHDVLFGRYTDPTDFDATCDYVRLQHIYKPLKRLEMNPMYNTNAIKRLKSFYATKEGILKAAETFESMAAKNERMESIGVPDIENPIVGEFYVEMSYDFLYIYDKENKKNVLSVVVMAGGEILAIKRVKDLLNVDFIPVVTWADDIDRLDMYSDGVGDICRTPNKIINARFSQWVENGTLRNFGMNYYDATKKGFVPPSIQPAPWAWIPVPGKPSDVFQKVDVPELRENMEGINFIIGMIERATASTATQKGVKSKGQITLGEVKLMMEKAMERTTSMAKFYRIAWQEFAEKWIKLVMANGTRLSNVKLRKKGYKGKYYEKEVNPANFKSEKGFEVRVTSSAEQEKEQLGAIEKLSIIKSEFVGNKTFRKIYKKKLLDMAKLNPEEIKEIIEESEQIENTPEQQPGVLAPQQIKMPAYNARTQIGATQA